MPYSESASHLYLLTCHRSLRAHGKAVDGSCLHVARSIALSCAHIHSFLKTEKEPSEYMDGFYQESCGDLWDLQLSLKYVHNEIHIILS